MDQLQAAQVHEAYLPYATSDELLMILDVLQVNPGDNRSIIQLAAHAKTTARTVERRSQLEFCMTLGEWRQSPAFPPSDRCAGERPHGSADCLRFGLQHSIGLHYHVSENGRRQPQPVSSQSASKARPPNNK
jgi:hypothetical protein